MNYKILKAGKLYDDADKIIYAGCKCSYQDSGTESFFLINQETATVSNNAVVGAIRKSEDAA